MRISDWSSDVCSSDLHKALLDPKVWRPGAMSMLPRPLPMAPEAALDCASCHSIRDPHLGLFGKDCASCHTTASWRISDYRHPSVNPTQCPEIGRAAWRERVCPYV